LAAALALDRAPLVNGAAPAGGAPFWKMSGSGNDFVFFDARSDPLLRLRAAESIAGLCDRRHGVGADGVVFLEPGSGEAALRMAYFNSDGSRASMCGNAALCTTRLVVALGAAPPAGFCFDSDVGLVHARVRDGQPEVDLSPVRDLAPAVAAIELAPGEERVGFVLAGVPHLVVHAADADTVDLASRGRALRSHSAVLPAGANANFVSPGRRGEWRMRTYERGVEGETLACGTGAVACAALIRAWGFAGAASDAIDLVTRSGRTLSVRFAAGPDGMIVPSLRGEGRIVFHGELIGG
jgi:diaminopimelate epimerase